MKHSQTVEVKKNKNQQQNLHKQWEFLDSKKLTGFPVNLYILSWFKQLFKTGK